jgi:glutathione synthase/RimK-type ligase-like ATP-grasp enzyme
VLNSADAISRASDKLLTLELLNTSQPHFEFTTDVDVVHEDVVESDATWFGRAKRGFGGRDIGIINQEHAENIDLPFPFYTKYVDNSLELRFHVFKGEVIRYQKKCKRDGSTDDSCIKNHANGYIFQTPELRPNQERFDAAVRAVNILGLDFGAVDLIVPHNNPRASVVLEVNTAPACSPLTLSAYVEAITSA